MPYPAANYATLFRYGDSVITASATSMLLPPWEWPVWFPELSAAVSRLLSGLRHEGGLGAFRVGPGLTPGSHAHTARWLRANAH